ncbi:unnamed protein product [Eruca vesicaria subsp. sativa]|uniref:Protein kinase domain-containing protein n=1 Tax=Eruca vesicaria subsp. sativa TaxID=29727 RepID=A0ABC8JRJ9_ERUVS|nr:unnamed protein product [Eruca vesicaria subsp. sativa]
MVIWFTTTRSLWLWSMFPMEISEITWIVGKDGKTLDMATRLDIAADIAHTITYLHMYTQPPLIHRDIKSSNILLTDSFRAKLADFGFARLAPDTESGATHVSTQDKGTAGS